MINIAEVLVANLSGLLILFIIIFARRSNRLEDTKASRYFHAATILAFWGTLSELIGCLSNGHLGTFWYVIAWISNTFIFMIPIGLASIWVIYAEYRISKCEHPFYKFRYKFIPLYIIEFIILTNPITGYIFSISKDNIYSRGPLAIPILGVFILYLFYSLWMVNEARKKNVIYYYFPAEYFVLPLVVMISLQMMFYGISCGWLGVDIALMSIQIQIQNEISYVDSLTGIFNRKYMDYAMENIIKSKKPHYGIMIDMDNFKMINDSYGHDAGDHALKEFAEILLANTPSSAQVLRYAGDEFVVLLPSAIDIEQVIANLYAGSDMRNADATNLYDLQFSCGYSLYDGTKSREEFMKEMDMNMYANKQARSNR